LKEEKLDDRHGLKPLLERVLRDRNRTSDPEAWSGLMGRVRLLVRAELALKVRQADDASDLAQEVQKKILRAFPRFGGETVPSFLCWVEMIVVSVLASYWRRRPPPVGLDALPAEPPGPVPDPDAFDAEQIGRVLEAVEQLPDPGRAIVRAFYLEGLTCAQIAGRMNRAAVWVRVTKLYAVRQLRDRLGGRP
jgi:RNA polymerase sigma factor (sigma-70 family)